MSVDRITADRLAEIEVWEREGHAFTEAGKEFAAMARKLRELRAPSREMLMRFAMGYDQEDSAQRGEPSPWRDLSVCQEDVAWAEERIACAKAGWDAMIAAAPPPGEA